MTKEMHDSGKRQQFEGGAQRDTAEGKPQLHLLSPHIYHAATMRRNREEVANPEECRDEVLYRIQSYMLTKETDYLYQALGSMFDLYGTESLVEWLRLGAEKYDAFNWAKGMPLTRVVDSLLRHCAKWFSDDEDHPAAVMCNLMFLIHYEREIAEGRLDPKWDDLFNFDRREVAEEK